MKSRRGGGEEGKKEETAAGVRRASRRRNDEGVCGRGGDWRGALSHDGRLEETDGRSRRKGGQLDGGEGRRSY